MEKFGIDFLINAFAQKDFNKMIKNVLNAQLIKSGIKILNHVSVLKEQFRINIGVSRF